MYDTELALNILTQIQEAALKILNRFKPVRSIGDFTDTEAGMEKLDSICMLLIAIGEALKNMDKVTQNSILIKYPQVDWKRAKGMRDIISHHYFEMDADVIFDVCRIKIPELSQTIHQIIYDLKQKESSQPPLKG
ncbi:MAG: DUF86 domain-containing protein [Desulfobacula sp.]|jgi:uncharacterized protein with HEPN domain|nr:DUF86 domain-containing protein [Desulfobacula sp.]